MKLIRISTENEISVHEFPDGSYAEQNAALRELIGEQCELYEHVMPTRLYSQLGCSNRPTKDMGDCVSMLIDEEGLYHNLAPNFVGSYLYETDLHGHTIVGNILIVGEEWTSDGIDFCGISEEQFNRLYPQLDSLVKEAKKYENSSHC